MTTKGQQKYAPLLIRLLRFLAVAFSLLLILALVGWHLVRTDHNYIIHKIEETVSHKWNAKIRLQGYQIEWVPPFPTIRLEARQLVISNNLLPQQALLHISHAATAFRPWALLSGHFKGNFLQLDSVWVHLYKDSLNRSNMTFTEEADSNFSVRKSAPFPFSISEWPLTTIQYLDFHHQNEAKGKWQKAVLEQARISPEQNAEGEWCAHLQSDCFIEGLLFGQRDGSFLRKTDAYLDLQFSLSEGDRQLNLKHSYLQVEQNRYLLSGSYLKNEPDYLQLHIATEGVLVCEVLPLLSDRIQQTLIDISVDQPVVAAFTLDSYINSGKKETLKVDFAAHDALILYQDINMSGTSLKGYFSNDCDGDGIGSNEGSCVVIEQLDGDLYQAIPSQLQGTISQLEQPLLDAKGHFDIDLPRLNPLLISNKKATFQEGEAQLDFEYSARLEDVIEAPFDEARINMKGVATFDNIRPKILAKGQALPALCGSLTFDDQQTMLDELSLHWHNSNIHLSGQLRNLPEFLFYSRDALIGQLYLHFDEINLDEFTSKETTTPKRKPGYDDFRAITRSIASNINGSILLEIDKLSYDTFFVTDLKSAFKLFSPRYAEYVDSAMIQIEYLNANVMGNAPVELDISLPRDTTTEVNLNMRLPKAVPVVNLLLPKGNTINQGKASIRLSAKGPLRALLQPKRLLYDFTYEGIVDFEQLHLQMESFSRPVQGLSGTLKADNTTLLLENFRFNYEGSPFLVNAKVEDYPFLNTKESQKARVYLNVDGDHLDLRNNEARRIKAGNQDQPMLSPPRLFRGLDTLFQHALLTVDLYLDSILTMDHLIQPMVCQARLLPDDLIREQHQLVIDSFNLGFGSQNNLRGHARITNPDVPQLEMQMQAEMSFKKMGEFLPSEYIELQDGLFYMNLHYQSPLHDTLNAEKYLLDALIDGDAEIVDGRLFYNYRGFTFDSIYSQLHFDQRALFINKLALQVNNNVLTAKGESSDFFPFFVLPDQKATINLEVNSPRFDFGNFTAPHGLGKDSLILAQEEVPADSTSILNKTGGFIDQLLDKGSLHMSVGVDELKYRKFTGHHLRGDISLEPDSVQLSQVHMNMAKGTFDVDGSITNIVSHEPKMELAFNFEENDLREIFRQFNDFGQSDFGYQNVEGIASIRVDFKTDINSNYDILEETMQGEIFVSLTGGQLIEVPALKRVSGFLSKRRQLEHILIDTLISYSHLRGTALYVDHFYLHSTSFDFGVEGVYSLDDPTKTKMLFAIPISNLFSRHLTKKELNSGKSKRKGLRIFIEARQKRGRMRFLPKIPFNRKQYKMPKEDDDKG